MIDFTDVGRAVIAGGEVGVLTRVLICDGRKYARVKFESHGERTYLAERVYTAHELTKSKRE